MMWDNFKSYINSLPTYFKIGIPLWLILTIILFIFNSTIWALILTVIGLLILFNHA